MASTDKSFLISIQRCNSTTNASFHLYAVVKINATSNPARVSTLLHLPNSATVVPTNVDFSTYHISINFIRLLKYGSLDDSTIKSESTSAVTSNYPIDSDDSLSEHEVEAVDSNIEVVGGPNEQQEEIEGPIEDPIAEMGDEADILSVGTYYNEATEMTAFNNTLRGATEAQLESYYRTKRNLDRTTGQVDTLHEDSFCFVCRLKVVANDHKVKLGLHCVQPNCNRAQLYHFPCLLNYIFNTRILSRCDYCRPTGGR